MTHTDPPRHACHRTFATWAVATAAIAVSSGCQQVLFPPDTPRNQFDISDRQRNAFVPLQQPDVFGNPQPNLRGRLTRK